MLVGAFGWRLSSSVAGRLRAILVGAFVLVEFAFRVRVFIMLSVGAPAFLAGRIGR